MPKKISTVQLSPAERQYFENIISSGSEKARKLT